MEERFNIRIYKLSFPTQAAWKDKVKPTLQREIKTEEEFKMVDKQGIRITEIGNVPFDAVKNPETGEEISPAGFHDDWAVNVVWNPKLGGVDPVHLREFVLKEFPETWHTRVSGEQEEWIVKPI